MQVNPAPAWTAAALPPAKRGMTQLILAWLVERGRPGSPAHQTEQQRERRRRQHDPPRATTAAQASRPAEVIYQAERRLEPGTRTRRRAQLRALARDEQLRFRRRAFRQALSEAKERGGARQPKSAGAATRTDRGGRPAAMEDPPAARTGRRAVPSAGPEARSNSPGPTAQLPATRAGSAVAGAGGASAVAPPAHVPFAAPGRQVAAPTPLARSGAAGPQAVQPASGRAPAGAVRGVGPAAEPAAGPASGRDTPGGRLLAARRWAGPRAARAGEGGANIERVLRTIHSRLGPRRSRAIVLLDPPKLGSVRLHMDLRGEALRLRIDTQTELAQRLLRKELARLHRGLESAGIRLEHVEIRAPQPDPEGAGQPPGQQAARWHGDHGAGAGPGARQPGQQGAPTHRGDGAALARQDDVFSRGGEPQRTAAESLVNLWA